ncbi:MAG TPA: type II toxin-antitoxin system HicA family toxin [Cyclobacteriaceae bacterium]|nr:type II toxin-antitoxin system HicA family toxin [Cyclobacteriaceae bacterium]
MYENQLTGKITVVPVHGSRDLPKGTFLVFLNKLALIKINLNESQLSPPRCRHIHLHGYVAHGAGAWRY